MATNPYNPPSIGPDYNLDPPSDDGAQTENNRLQWSKHKGKLSDPIVSWQEADQGAISDAFDKTINTDPDEKNTMAGGLAFEPSTLTVSNDEITPTRSSHIVDTESGAATDDLVTIDHTSVDDETLLMLRGADPARVTTLKQQASPGNIILDNGADFPLSENATIQLQRRGTVWVETNRSAGVSSLRNWQFFETLTMNGSEEESADITGDPLALFLQFKQVTVTAAGVDPQLELRNSTYATASYGLANALGGSTGAPTFWGGGSPIHTGPAPLTGNLTASAEIVGEVFARKTSDEEWTINVQMMASDGTMRWSSGKITVPGDGNIDKFRLSLSSASTYASGTVDAWLYR